MHDKSLLMERLAARRLIQKYNQYPWPEEGSDDYFGPDDRREVLAKLFGLTLEDFKNKSIEIEPPFYCESRHSPAGVRPRNRETPRVFENTQKRSPSHALLYNADCFYFRFLNDLA